MDSTTITGDAVRAVLRALRYGRALEDSPLFELRTVRDRIRREGLSNAVDAVLPVLGRYLDEIVWEHLSRLRHSRATPFRAGLTSEDEIAMAEIDFQTESTRLQAWSVLYLRYFAADRLPLVRLPHRLGASRRTLSRRTSLGYESLAAALRRRERESEIEERRSESSRAYEQILFVADLSSRSPDRAMAALRSGIAREDEEVRLSPDEVEGIVRYPVADLVEYRLGRIAEWSQPRYRLDERFVELSLLVDLGEESPAGRWRDSETRYQSLDGLLGAVSDPALVLLGPPGAGKTTILRHLELVTAIQGLRESTQTLTFFVSLSRYGSGRSADGVPDPRDWLAEEWASLYPNLRPLAELLAEGNMLLLLDALNELPHGTKSEYRERVLLWKELLLDLAGSGTGNRLVFSCRSLDYSTPLSTPELRVPQVSIRQMSDDQVLRFLEVYCPGRGQAIWDEFDQADQLDVLRSPYFLSLLVDQAAEEERLVADRAALFTGFTRSSLRREIERDNPLFSPGRVVTGRDCRRVVQAHSWSSPYTLPDDGVLFGKLSQLAHSMQDRETMAERAQVRARFATACELLDDDEARRIIAAAEALGIVLEDVRTDDVLFCHQLLQEYFAARQLADNPDPGLVRSEWRAAGIRPSVEESIDELCSADELPGLPQTGWEETTALAATMTADPDSVVRDVARANLALAGRIAAQPEVRERLCEAGLDELRWALVARSRDQDADLRHRIECGYAVGDLGDPRYELRQGPYGEYLFPPVIEIEAGTYPIGDDEPIDWTIPGTRQSGTTVDHTPRHEVYIAALGIGRFPVTNAEFACFVSSGAYDDERWWDTADARRWQRGELAPEGPKLNNRLWRQRLKADPALLDRVLEQGLFKSQAQVDRWREWMALDDQAFEEALDAHWQPKRRSEPRHWRERRYNRPSQPVVALCWYEGRAYCNWLSAQAGQEFRLPTELEWEAAARGREGRRYPWGDEFCLLRANTFVTHVRKPTPVGVFPSGDTPEKVADLGGNVSEWTSSLRGGLEGDELSDATYRYPYDATDGREDPEAPPSVSRVVRGGYWSGGHAHARAARRGFDLPDGATDSGFRLVSPRA